MDKRTFAKFVKRDSAMGVDGNPDDGTLIPNHRINRSVGGTDAPSNIVTLGSIKNGLLEPAAEERRIAIRYGWKLESWQDPLEEPFYHLGLRRWFQPDDSFELRPVPIPARMFSL